jgi:chromosome segregation ATPase
MKLHLFRKRPKSGSSKHLNNILSGETIYIDGKPYVKVKVRFVDSLNFNTEKHLDNLETEIESLRKEVERLNALNNGYEKTIEDLQILNINMFRKKRIETTDLCNTIDKLVQYRNRKDLEKENLKTQVEAASLKIDDQAETIIRLREKVFNQKWEINRLLRREKELQSKIESLQLSNKNLINDFQVKMTRLRKKNAWLKQNKKDLESQVKNNGHENGLQDKEEW